MEEYVSDLSNNPYRDEYSAFGNTCYGFVEDVIDGGKGTDNNTLNTDKNKP
ncbi:MAG: hypothetical protein GY820_28490 [Gammaproteobacteria bacterium]|nr:hypothetical protein [Gammaproteobacteria bacterium]